MSDNSNFDDIIRIAKRERDERAKTEAATREKKRAERKSFIRSAAKALRSKVLPVIEGARTALRKERITIEAQEDFDVLNTMRNPRLIVQIWSPGYSNVRGGVSEPRSEKLYIGSDGVEIRWGFSSRYSNSQEREAGMLNVANRQLERALNEALRHCLETYYIELDKLSR